MSTPIDPSQRRPLSEIGHLFLSSVRDRQTNGAQRPKRIPPGGPRLPSNADKQPAHSLDMTPEEFAAAYGLNDTTAHPLDDELEPRGVSRKPLTAVISSHLNGHQVDRVRQYAAHLAQAGERVGLIIVDASELRLISYEPTDAPDEVEPAPRTVHTLDARRMEEALVELSYDVDRWLLLMPCLRGTEARALLKLARHWVLLTTCDHDGVVSSYRTLKGLLDVVTAHGAAKQAARQPRLTVSLLDAPGEAHATKLSRKLAGVCRQFLHWSLTPEPPTGAAPEVAEHPVLWCRATADKAQLAAAPQWHVVSDFLSKHATEPAVSLGDDADPADSLASDATEPTDARGGGAASMQFDQTDHAQHDEEELAAAIDGAPGDDEMVAKPQAASHANHDHNPHRAGAIEMVVPERPHEDDAMPSAAAPVPPAAAHAPSPMPMPTPMSIPMHIAANDPEQVIDLPAGAVGATAIAQAVIRGGSDLVETAIRAPMCDGAVVCVSRDRRLVLLAAASAGLGELRQIAQAYRWLCDSKQLITMALPQMALSPDAAPQLRLLVDHADLSNGILQPLLTNQNSTVQAYRRLKWGGRTGLLLEAA